MDEQRLLTTPEAAAHFEISPRTLARWAKEGLLKPTVTLPTGRYRWTIADMRAQMEKIREQAREDDT